MRKNRKIISSLLAILIIAGMMMPAAYASSYWDVSDQDFYAESIAYVTEKGIMSGVGNSSFAPNDTLDRAQFVAILHRLVGSPTVAYSGEFQDVPDGQWYTEAVEWANEKGIVSGTSAGVFSPMQKVTKEQVAAIIARFVNSEGFELWEAENPVYGFKDSWYTSSYANEGVIMVWRVGIMNGDSDHNFHPKAQVSRAEAADIFMRLDKAIAGEVLTVTKVPSSNRIQDGLSEKEKNQQALTVAKQIASVIPTNVSDLERVSEAAYIVSFYCQFCEYTMEGKDYRTPYGVFVKGEFSCAGATRALGMVLECMGYEWEHVNENGYTHQWCKLTMDGQVGFADGQGGFAGYGEHWAAM